MTPIDIMYAYLVAFITGIIIGLFTPLQREKEPTPHKTPTKGICKICGTLTMRTQDNIHICTRHK